MRSFAVVINDCAAPPVKNPLQLRTLATDQGPANFNFNVDHLTAGLPRPLPAAEMDWVEILAYLFAIDIACERGDGDTEWARHIEAWLPVRDPDYWSTKARRVENLFADLTMDRLILNFQPASTLADPPRQSRTRVPAETDCIALLSGGVDSFAGAIELINSSRHPLLVSHIAGGATTTAQSRVAAALRDYRAGASRKHFRAQRERTFPGDDSSQRSRTLLYVGLAAVAAAQLEVEDVYLNENGIMAIHVPLTAARIGSLSTQTASPFVMERFANLASEILGNPVAVRNLFLTKTKPEVVEGVLGSPPANALQDTVSCWQIGRTRQHCGYCIPCVMRRVSFEWNTTRDVTYATDVFNDHEVLIDARVRDNLVHLGLVTQDFLKKSDLELELEYPELLNTGSNATSHDVLAMHKRWAGQVEEVLFPQPVMRGLI
jgi:hypothetical protein